MCLLSRWDRRAGVGEVLGEPHASAPESRGSEPGTGCRGCCCSCPGAGTGLPRSAAAPAAAPAPGGGVQAGSWAQPAALAARQLKCVEMTPPGRQRFSLISLLPARSRADIGWKVEQLVRDNQWESIELLRRGSGLGKSRRSRRGRAGGGHRARGSALRQLGPGRRAARPPPRARPAPPGATRGSSAGSPGEVPRPPARPGRGTTGRSPQPPGSQCPLIPAILQGSSRSAAGWRERRGAGARPDRGLRRSGARARRRRLLRAGDRGAAAGSRSPVPPRAPRVCGARGVDARPRHV